MTRGDVVSHSVVMTTVDSEEEAGSLADLLVSERLAACVQVTTVRSHYVWEGESCRSDEWLLVIKTTAERVVALIDRLEQVHSYDTPEVVEVPITGGSADYLAWLGAAVSPAGDV